MQVENVMRQCRLSALHYARIDHTSPAPHKGICGPEQPGGNMSLYTGLALAARYCVWAFLHCPAIHLNAPAPPSEDPSNEVTPVPSIPSLSGTVQRHSASRQSINFLQLFFPSRMVGVKIMVQRNWCTISLISSISFFRWDFLKKKNL